MSGDPLADLARLIGQSDPFYEPRIDIQEVIDKLKIVMALSSDPEGDRVKLQTHFCLARFFGLSPQAFAVRLHEAFLEPKPRVPYDSHS